MESDLGLEDDRRMHSIVLLFDIASFAKIWFHLYKMIPIGMRRWHCTNCTANVMGEILFILNIIRITCILLCPAQHWWQPNNSCACRWLSWSTSASWYRRRPRWRTSSGTLLLHSLEIRHLNFPLCQLMHPKSEYKYFRYFNIYLFSILQNYIYILYLQNYIYFCLCFSKRRQGSVSNLKWQNYWCPHLCLIVWSDKLLYWLFLPIFWSKICSLSGLGAYLRRK